MKHAASRELYAYWDERRGQRPAPERADIEPGAIRAALSDTFILELDAADGHSFRLAGTRVCALFGRELKGESFIDLWALGSRGPIADLLAISTDESVGTVAGVTAHSTADERSSSSFCCCRSACAGRGWRAPSAYWRRSSRRHGSVRARSGR